MGSVCLSNGGLYKVLARTMSSFRANAMDGVVVNVKVGLGATALPSSLGSGMNFLRCSLPVGGRLVSLVIGGLLGCSRRQGDFVRECGGCSLVLKGSVGCAGGGARFCNATLSVSGSKKLVMGDKGSAAILGDNRVDLCLWLLPSSRAGPWRFFVSRRVIC